MGKVEVRRFSHADAVRVAEIYVESAEMHALLNPRVYHRPDTEAVAHNLVRHEERPDSATYVGLIDGEVAGFLQLRVDHRRDVASMERPVTAVFIDQVAVSETFRRRGVGDALLAVAEEWAHAQSAGFVYLAVATGNQAAVRFYREAGGYEPNAEILVKHLT